MNQPRLLLVASLLLGLLSSALPAADITGKWTAEFDTQIGIQKYVYEFKSVDDKLTGTATYDHAFGKGSVALQAITVEGERVSFTESFKADGMDLTITYSGKLTDQEMTLARHVGDFATEQVVAHRVPPSE